MQQIDDALILSASDLNNYLSCRHLTELDLAKARGLSTVEPERGADAELLARKGDEHEERYLQSLRDRGLSIIEIPSTADGSLAALEDVVRQTEEALHQGPDVIYQATFLRDGMRGHADFLFKVDEASALGDYSYEVADTKLARRAKPYFIIQLCFYSELLAAAQGVEPKNIHVILGTNEEHSFRLAEFSAYFRHVRDGFLAEIGADRSDTYPIPVEHCNVCRWRAVCDAKREADDHLSLVAGIQRRQYERLEDAGINKLAELARDGEGPIPGLRAEQLAKLHNQAALQLRQRDSGVPEYNLLPYEERRGFARLPQAADGDVFFDMEGDPFFDDGGLEYLFGLVTTDTGQQVFTPIWGGCRGEEKRAFEQFIDFVTERRESHPDLHIYHYAHYEVTALKRLAGQHGTREEELDQLLRGEVFVDLYKVVREGMRISQPSYSIKKVEAFYMEERDTAVTDGGDSIVMFEQWLEEHDDSILQKIADYNEDDCESTLKLRDWLLGLRAEAEKLAGHEIPWFEHEAKEPSDAMLARLEMNEPLMEGLLAGVPDDPQTGTEDQQARWLMAQILEYHHREARPVWWSFFNRQTVDVEELVDDADCIGDLHEDPGTPPRPEKQSLLFRMLLPAQETKMGTRTDVCDAVDGGNPGTIYAINVEEGWLDLKRGRTVQQRPLPTALIPGRPIPTDAQEGAIRRLAETMLEEWDDCAAAMQILRRERPRLTECNPGEPIDHPDMEVDELKEVVAALHDSYLFIQGPPGSGKTWCGARLIVDLIGRGKRVGVTSTSHKVIHNLLKEVEEVASAEGATFRGLKKCSDDNPESEFDSQHGLIDSTSSVDEMNDPGVSLTAGTAWHFCREDTEPVDYLFIDEAGQISLADALALSTAARNVVLLGDPQQLPQVAQAAHPVGSSLSVLEHLLGDAQTVDPRSGVFLDKTWRLHPEVCKFVSELMYDGRLHSAPGRERQRVDAKGHLTGTGLRFMEVEHEGNSQSSKEEAVRVAEAIAPLLDGATYTDCEGGEHPLRAEDILVVTPYNAQVKCLEQRLPAGVRVGTVDKFQGQQAQIVFFSMATSSQDEIPRNVEFLFSRNRLNVAVSRARCLAVLVASPRLLDISAKSIKQMRLVGALCRFGEVAAR